MHNLFFWAITVALLFTALAFVLPPLWISPNNARFSMPERLFYSCLLVMFVCFFSYYEYWKLGSAKHLAAYYSAAQIQLRDGNEQIRPVYAKLQRELIKNRLDLQLDIENIDLILHFAGVHSRLQDGILQAEVVQLLEAVLKAVPQQVTALNLLAINAFKQQQYAKAGDYWETILQQFTAEMRDTEVEHILKNKVAATRIKQKQFESRQTNNKIL